jgi:hypothetical protein
MLSPLETGTTRVRPGNVGGAGRPALARVPGPGGRRAASAKTRQLASRCGEAGQGPSISYMEGPCLILPGRNVFARVGNAGNAGNTGMPAAMIWGQDTARARSSGGRGGRQ